MKLHGERDTSYILEWEKISFLKKAGMGFTGSNPFPFTPSWEFRLFWSGDERPFLVIQASDFQQTNMTISMIESFLESEKNMDEVFKKIKSYIDTAKEGILFPRGLR